MERSEDIRIQSHSQNHFGFNDLLGGIFGLVDVDSFGAPKVPPKGISMKELVVGDMLIYLILDNCYHESHKEVVLDILGGNDLYSTHLDQLASLWNVEIIFIKQLHGKNCEKSIYLPLLIVNNYDHVSPSERSLISSSKKVSRLDL